MAEGHTPLSLNRMEIEEAGPNPDRLAAAIHDQLALDNGPVDVRSIAFALDIVEIRAEVLISCEGALITTPERNEGAILVNRNASPQRQRLTIAHELGHFLDGSHQGSDGTGGFICTTADLLTRTTARGVQRPRHVAQEAQANQFAIELLAPRTLVSPFLSGDPDLSRVLDLARSLDLSREASARRFVELQDPPLAAVFSHAGKIRYVERGRGFPFLIAGNGMPVPALAPAAYANGLSRHNEAEASEWLVRPGPQNLIVQTLHQQGGYAITLLRLGNKGLAAGQ